MHANLKLIDLFERILVAVKPGHEDDEEIVECRKGLIDLRKRVDEDMLEWMEMLEECIPDVTEGPWCGFTDDGKLYAVMPAGRSGDVFKFEEPPKEADGQYLVLAQPHVVQLMIDRIRKLENQVKSEVRWTSLKEKKTDGA